MVTSEQPIWISDGLRIFLALPDGTRCKPTALEIYRSATGGTDQARGFEGLPNISSVLPELRFSQFPVEPVIQVSGVAPRPASITMGISIDQVFLDIGADDDAIVSGSTWHPIDTEGVAAAMEWLDGYGVTLGSEATLAQLMRLRLATDGPVRLEDNYVLEDSPDFASKAASANLVNSTLYPYQERGVAYLRHIADQDIGCFLADEMGLGKTLQIIALLVAESSGGRSPNLVVCPATLVENWKRELSRFAPDMRVVIHAGADRAGTSRWLLDADVVITTYDTAIRDVVILESVRWNVVAADEAQAIKNPDAQRTAALKALPRRVSIAISGTPVENSLQDLWSLSDFALPGFLGDRRDFLGKFADDRTDAMVLGDRISPLILRRRVAEVAKDLPDRIEIPQPVSVDSDFCEVYERLRQDTLAEYEAGAGMVAMTRLRMLCAHPDLLGEPYTVPTESPKFSRLLEILEEVFAAGEKAIIFTTYRRMTDLLMRRLSARWKQGCFDFIDSRVAVETRQGVVDRFNAFPGSGALVLNPKAAGTGLNITAANHVIHYNPEWNPAVTDQASARSHRRGQTLPVTIHHLFLAGTIEEAIMDRSGFKRELSVGAVRDNEGMSESELIKRALQMSPVTTR